MISNEQIRFLRTVTWERYIDKIVTIYAGFNGRNIGEYKVVIDKKTACNIAASVRIIAERLL